MQSPETKKPRLTQEVSTKLDLRNIRKILTREGLEDPGTTFMLYASLRGASAALKFFGKSPEEQGLQFKLKHASTPVGQADIDSENQMVSVARGFGFKGAIIGEETGRIEGETTPSVVANLLRRGNRRRFAGTETSSGIMIMDGVDGSIPFTHGDVNWATNNAICQKELNGIYIPTIASIVTPLLGEALVAERGKGTFTIPIDVKRQTGEVLISGELQKASVSNQSNFEKARIGIDAIMTNKNESLKTGLLRDLHTKSQGNLYVDMVGSNAVTAGKVATGKLDGWVMDCVGGEWDVLSAALAIEEAGGICTDIQGNQITLENAQNAHVIIGSNGKIHKELLQAVQTHYSDYAGFR